MRRILALALLMVLPTTLWASSDDCQRLLAQGLIEYHGGRYSQALPLFEKSVSEDPTNLDALYYRGVTHGRLQQYDQAVIDLRAVLATQPNHPQATLDLGIALLQSGAAAEAVPLLEQAQRNPDQKTQAIFFLGLAQLRLGQYDAARTSFEAVHAADPTMALPARYYMGVSAYQASNWRQAEDDFGFVVTTRPDSEMGREATALLAQLRQGTPGKRLNRLLYIDTGFQYDSNVVLSPSDDSAQQVSDQGDGRAVFTAGALWAPLQTEHTELALGYEFFQSIHFDLSDYNLQDHRPTIQLIAFGGPLRAGIAGQYDYYFLHGNPFLQEAGATPWLQIAEGTFGRAELDYRFRYRDYLELPYQGISDAFHHSAGARQFFYLGAPERYLWAGFRYELEDPTHDEIDGTAANGTPTSEDNPFGYDSYQGSAGIGWALPYEITSDVGYSYRYEDYNSASDGRNDQEHRVIVAATKGLTEHLLLALAYLGTFNDSNQSVYQYNRHMVSLTLGVRF